MVIKVLSLWCISAVLADNAADPGCTKDGKTFTKGEQYNAPGYCSYNVCQGNDEWNQAACGLIGAPPGWTHIPEDTSKPYPDCCGRVLPPLDIVPDILDKVPGMESLTIKYGTELEVKQGNELTPTQVKSQPSVTYSADPKSFYLLCMIDPDAPSRQEPTSREFKHWLVGNIPGNNLAAGEALAEYVGSGPPQGTGFHRYVFVLYKQAQKLSFDEPRTSNTSAEGRRLFSTQKFAQKYNLGNPIAVNVYQAQYDDYVPEVHRQLGFIKK